MILPAVLFWQLCVTLCVPYFKVKVEPGKQGLWILFLIANFFLDAAFPEAWAYSFLSAHPLRDASRAMTKVQTQFTWEITECDACIHMYSRGQQSTCVSPIGLITLCSSIKDAPPCQTEYFSIRSHAFRKKTKNVFSWLDVQKCNLTQIL